MKDRQAASQYFLVAFLLTLSGGYIDAYTYTIRGSVFANAQTANIVLIGINIANQSLADILKYVFPVIAFAAGILLYDTICKRLIDRCPINRQSAVLLLEAVILAAAGFIPAGDKCNYAVNAMISFMTAMQYIAFKNLFGASYASASCTGMLRTACNMLRRFNRHHDIKTRNNAIWLFVMIIVFCIGCGIGGSMGKAFGTRSIWVCALFMAAVAAMLAAEDTGR